MGFGSAVNSGNFSSQEAHLLLFAALWAREVTGKGPAAARRGAKVLQIAANLLQASVSRRRERRSCRRGPKCSK